MAFWMCLPDITEATNMPLHTVSVKKIPDSVLCIFRFLRLVRPIRSSVCREKAFAGWTATAMEITMFTSRSEFQSKTLMVLLSTVVGLLNKSACLDFEWQFFLCSWKIHYSSKKNDCQNFKFKTLVSHGLKIVYRPKKNVFFSIAFLSSLYLNAYIWKMLWSWYFLVTFSCRKLTRRQRSLLLTYAEDETDVHGTVNGVDASKGKS